MAGYLPWERSSSDCNHGLYSDYQFVHEVVVRDYEAGIDSEVACGEVDDLRVRPRYLHSHFETWEENSECPLVHHLTQIREV